ncbi:hypothetical protein [Neptuniibacter sp. QD34_54]|uniref:hypothetical protein n=1 Tax=Neptuniibacter sp. QD34_54 TaxID=3398208 RepID=UPI0039F45FF2
MSRLDILKSAIQKERARIKKTTVLIIRGDAHCTTKINGKYYSVLSDPVREGLITENISVQVIAKPFSKLVAHKCADQAVDIEVGYSRAILAEKFCKGRIVSFWKKVIKESECKYIIAIFPNKELCLAANQLGVPIADLQHGVISFEHPSYGSEYRKAINKAELPSEYLLWDNNSKAVVDEWCLDKGIKTTVIGNPSFVKFGNDAIKKDNKKYNTVLYTLQWGLERESKDVGQSLRNFLWPKKLEEIAKSGSKHNWIFRIHPVQYPEKEEIFSLIKEFFGKESYDLSVKYDQMPLFEVLQNVDLHMTYNSSVAIESANLGITTIFLDQELKLGGTREGYYKYEKEAGIAIVKDIGDAELMDVKYCGDSRGCNYLPQLSCFNSFIDRLSKGKF